MLSAPPEAAGPRPSGGPPRVFRRGTLALRLTLGYAALFALSAAVLSALTYALLFGYLREQDRAFARAQLRAYAEAYARVGVPAVARSAQSLRGDDRGEELLVRVADAANRTLLLLPPEDWRPADFAALERRAPAGGERFVVHNEGEDDEVEVFSFRFADGVVLQAGMSSDDRNDVMEAFPDVFVTIALPLLVLAVAGGAFMAQRALRPVRHLLTTLRAIIATGDVRERAPDPDVRGEMAELFLLFNRMLDRIEGLVGRLRGTLDDVAHDLRTPLTRLRGTAELALREEREPQVYRDALADALEASGAVVATLDAIMDVAEAEAGAMRLRLRPIPVGDLVRDVAELYELVAEEKGIVLDAEVDGEAWARGDRPSLGRALANLVDNAVKYTPEGGRVMLRAFRDERGVHITVRDTGLGVGPEELPHVWDRHFRADRSRSERGLGLGLSLVRALIEGHGGSVEVESRLGMGSTFTVHLPGAHGDPGGEAEPSHLAPL